jgi:hypothetical protein
MHYSEILKGEIDPWPAIRKEETTPVAVSGIIAF